eukprot:1813680-Pleurochrysis_carterae.AAC.1
MASSRSSSPWRYAATKSHRLMRMPEKFAMAASARSDVGRMVAQKVLSKSMPRTCAHPCTHSRALSVPLRLRLYTHQIRRTMDLSSGTSE